MAENKEKRKLKNEPRLNIVLNEEQKDVKSKYYHNDVNIVMGDAGTGKTLVACHIALTAFRKKEINKIIISRPITKDNLGFLKGTIEEKMKPHVAPIVHNFNMLQSPQTTEKMMSSLDIEILPIDFAKGITYVDSCVILDEMQDCDPSDFRTMLTRLGKNSKLIICASKEQIHRSIHDSCISLLLKLENFGLVGYTELKSNHRNEIIPKILEYLEGKN